ncbi:MAG: hypothetical protein ACJ8F4_10025 [Sphingomonas sp.]
MAGLVLVLFGMLALTARSAIVAVTPDSLVSAPTPENSDELIQIGRHTVLLKHGSASNRIAHWIHGGSANSKAFEVGDGSFVANSDALTPDGKQRVGTVARMMTHVRDLKARILVSAHPNNPALSELRATHLRADLIADGVTPSRVSLSDEPIAGGRAFSKQPEIVVVISS